MWLLFYKQNLKGLSDDKEYEFCETRHSREKEKVEEIIRFKNKLLQDQKTLQNRKIVAFTGWNGFRTAIFIADEKDIIEIHPHLVRNGFLKILQDSLSMTNISAGVADLTAVLLLHCIPTSFNG